ncbi:MAG: isoamylase early set domain-containing protein [Chloroflexi bacterium]|nr:isoamylase early set domain-containing protein [Chloroflexota bacterium]
MSRKQTIHSRTPQPTPKRSAVQFRYESATAKTVFLAGDFNHWSFDGLPLRRNGDGLWHAKVQLPPGRHEYRFIVDGDWQNDPHACGVEPNEFGSCNCVLEVGA